MNRICETFPGAQIMIGSKKFTRALKKRCFDHTIVIFRHYPEAFSPYSNGASEVSLTSGGIAFKIGIFCEN